MYHVLKLFVVLSIWINILNHHKYVISALLLELDARLAPQLQQSHHACYFHSGEGRSCRQYHQEQKMVTQCFCLWFCSRLLLDLYMLPMCDTHASTVYSIGYTCNVFSVVVELEAAVGLIVPFISSACSIGSSTLSSCARLSAKTVEIKVTKTPGNWSNRTFSLL